MLTYIQHLSQNSKKEKVGKISAIKYTINLSEEEKKS